MKKNQSNIGENRKSRSQAERKKRTLKNKTILLVDDEYNSRLRYSKALEDAGAIVLTARSIENALTLLDNGEYDFNFAILDLHIPTIPNRLEKYTKQITLTTNQAQSLGLFLTEEYPQIKYIYLSLVPNSLCCRVKTENEVEIIDKNRTLSKSLPSKLLKIDYLFDVSDTGENQ